MDFQYQTSVFVGLIVLMPLLSSAIVGLLGGIPWKSTPRMSGTVAGILASGSIFVSFVFSLILFSKLGSESKTIIEYMAFPWIEVGEFSIPMKFRFDNLSGLLCMIITGIGFLIHVYSIGYMHDDKNPQRYFCYLNLFSASMLILVLGASLPILFIGWEGVGLCSYLLIGFWFEDEAKAAAGKKAFIVNRIGDLGFLVGIFLTYATFRTLDFMELREMVEGLSPYAVITAITICLFIGATGKSAQLPLFVWLPDAMAGPTPVSALIHAATMVTAGVYLCCRLGFMYSLTPLTSTIILYIALGTAFVSATIAIVQNDIKKVLAYSTVSQLGFMFVAVGVGAYWVAVFHLMTHAFFKALMFLGSGSVIHAMGGEQDMRKMGGLKDYMPATMWTFAVGTLAISGIPFFSGFFSKDEILWQTFSSPLGGIIPYLIMLLTAAMTATYMTRLFCMTFLGECRADKKTKDHLHESPQVMTVPLMVLAFFAAFGGFLGFPHFIGGDTIPNWLHHFLVGIVPDSLGHGTHAQEYALLAVSIIAAGTAMGLTYLFFMREEKGSAATARDFAIPAGPKNFLSNSYYLNELYNVLFVKPLTAASDFLWKIVDVILIDGLVLSTARLARFSGQFARGIQTGVLEHYLLVVVFGFVAVAVWVLAVII